MQPLREVMERRSDEASAQDFSRLAWLYAHVGQTSLGLRAAERGLEVDPDRRDCRRFVAKMEKSRG